MSKLRISDALTLPLDAATQTFAFIGRKGSGKSYGAGKLVELLIDAGVQVAILDTVGNWYGLRLGHDGKASGIDVPIVGGLRGDIPLEATGGALIAESLVESGRSMVIDASQFSKADRQRFAATLGEKLWRLKKAERQPTPIHLVIEESQLIVPENVRGDAALMVGTYEEIIRLGRNYGIGVTMITQRPQSVNKEVLNQTECLFVFQVNGAHERDALKKWIVHQGMDVDLLNQLPGLEVGDCFVWSPQWLRVLKKIRIAPKRTFDSTSTPRVGQGTFRGKELKSIDLVDLQAKMAASIERAKADDPRELRKEIALLKKQLAERPKEQVTQTKIEYVEVPVLKNGQLDKANLLVGRLEDIWQKVGEQASGLKAAIADKTRPAPTPVISKKPQPLPVARPIPQRRPEISPPTDGQLTINKTQQRILDALAWYESLGQMQPTVVQVGAVALIDATGGYFSNTVGPLASAGLIERGSGTMRLTDAGRALASPIESPGTLADYHDVLRARIRKIKSAGGKTVEILDTIIAAGGGSLRADEIGQAVNVDHTGGYFSNCIGPLGTVGLIERRGGVVTPTDVLFPPGLQ